jgi:hypothetical protein
LIILINQAHTENKNSKNHKIKKKKNNNIAVVKLLANVLKNKVKECYYRPFIRALPTLKQDM